MAVNETRRHALGVKAREVLGVDDGETLMELLPPVGWGDVARKSDLEALRLATKSDIEATVNAAINRLILWLVPLLLAYGAALVRLG